MQIFPLKLNSKVVLTFEGPETRRKTGPGAICYCRDETSFVFRLNAGDKQGLRSIKRADTQIP